MARLSVNGYIDKKEVYGGRYNLLITVSIGFKFMAWVTGIATAAGVFLGPLLSRHGILISIYAFIAGAGTCLWFLGVSEGIKLLIDIAVSTRRTAEAAERRDQ